MVWNKLFLSTSTTLQIIPLFNWFFWTVKLPPPINKLFYRFVYFVRPLGYPFVFVGRRTKTKGGGQKNRSLFIDFS